MSCKKCPKCGHVKDTSEFYKHTSYCKECFKQYQREKAKPRNRETTKRYTLQSRFGLTLERFMEMYEDQKGQCAICGLDLVPYLESDGRNVACVDHDHSTGAVRGLLCHHCNTAIGLLREDAQLFINAINYLEGNK